MITAIDIFAESLQLRRISRKTEKMYCRVAALAAVEAGIVDVLIVRALDRAAATWSTAGWCLSRHSTKADDC
jgi:hypothetical protein